MRRLLDRAVKIIVMIVLAPIVVSTMIVMIGTIVSLLWIVDKVMGDRKSSTAAIKLYSG